MCCSRLHGGPLLATVCIAVHIDKLRWRSLLCFVCVMVILLRHIFAIVNVVWMGNAIHALYAAGISICINLLG